MPRLLVKDKVDTKKFCHTARGQLLMSCKVETIYELLIENELESIKLYLPCPH